ncbi:MAG: hypothetical protein JNJ85_05790 [Candidatus Kapabacteria bacterium]|nr:hypothetical protein [Candidatus Kapabacteria bacterium]
MKLFLLYLLFGIVSYGNTTLAQTKQDYTEYYNHILQIEEFISNEKFTEALSIYKRVFDTYKFVYAKDAYNACQISCMIHDANAEYYILRCALAGVPKNTLLQSFFVRAQFIQDSATLNTKFDSLLQEYNKTINQPLRNEFMHRFTTEQEHKGKPDYKNICTDNFNRIMQLASRDTFPGEKTIGINDALENSFVSATLKHYPYSYALLKQYISNAILHGELQPLQAMYIYSFNQTRTSVLYTNNIQTDTSNFTVCYNLPFGKQSQNVDEVNKQRKLMFISPTYVHAKMEAVMSKYRFSYNFGY